MQGIDTKELDGFIEQALREDIGDGDHTSQACIPEDSSSTAELLVKDVGVIAGVELARYIFKKVDGNSVFETIIEDGSDIKPGDIVFRVKCQSRSLLVAERLVLNLMQRLSGISTLASRFACEVEGMDVKILDTRKTTPNMRFLEKWAVRIGGCYNYRSGLYDWIMVKDNHIDACGGVSLAIDRVNAYLRENNLDLKITIEVRNLVELAEVLEHGHVTRVMLDNFELPLLKEAVATVGKRFETEASGGVTLNNVRMVAQSGVDFISVGALTHSAGSLDLSLKVTG
jgi:nicotinate-nucleotide pyrophosphorylase (carboxylating)